MPRLYLLRHAKAEPANAGGSDRDRDLAERGIGDAEAVGAALAAYGERIALVLCSPSARTLQTLDGVRPALDGATEIRTVPALYTQEDYLDILRREGGDAASILVVGHNPAVRNAALTLAGTASPVRIGESFPTAALAVFDVDGDWAGLRPGAAKLVEFRLPRGR